MDWIGDLIAKWLPALITVLMAAYVAYKTEKRKDKQVDLEVQKQVDAAKDIQADNDAYNKVMQAKADKAREDYWEKVAADLRREMAQIRNEAAKDRELGAEWRVRATQAFDYLCRRVAKVDPGGVEVARKMWDGSIVLVEDVETDS
jgi:hypothetical protein